MKCALAQIHARLVLAILLAAGLAGCGKPTKTYAVTPFAAWAALVGTTIPDTAFWQYAHALPATGTWDRVTWTIESGPAPGFADSNDVIMRLTATLTPVAGGTAVAVDIQPAERDDPARIAVLDSKLPAVAHLWRAIAAEQVDAVLTHRDFDLANIRLATVAADMAQLAHLPQIGRRMDDAAKAIQSHEQDKIDQAYALDKHGG